MDKSQQNQTSDSGDSVERERRGPDRTREDADWESKVLGRLGGRLRNLPVSDGNNESSGGWESSVVDELRRRFERGPT